MEVTSSTLVVARQMQVGNDGSEDYSRYQQLACGGVMDAGNGPMTIHGLHVCSTYIPTSLTCPASDDGCPGTYLRIYFTLKGM